ncbi:MAG: non-reducing end alpha-L-arabinofuranosidase family hydrolase [Bryobacteraceae bacterium]
MKNLVPLLPVLCLSLSFIGWSGREGTTPLAANGITLQLSTSTLTVPEGSSASTAVTLARTGNTGSVTFSVTGLPAGATISYLNPEAASSGQITVMATTTALGTYPLTLQATDGTNSASSSLSLVVSAAAEAPATYAWSSSGPLISAIPNATHPIVSVKDPTVVYYENQWNVYATTADTSGNWNMVYLNFPDWSQASAAQPYYMDATPGFSGYHCAPELFYFTPQNKWYLIYQSGPPQYSTADDPTQPQTWTEPQSFFSSQPSTVSGWLDFWVICDSANCYLFFSGDNGNFYRSQTTIANFPNGFSTPQIIMQAITAGDLFEASRTYSLKGSTQYLTIIEAMGGPYGHRYFRAFLAGSLDGEWTPVTGANSFAAPFLGEDNVTFATGVTPWTDDFSHGEIIRDGYDETLQIDPNNLQFLYQGDNPTANAASYSQIPWQLGLASAISSHAVPTVSAGGVLNSGSYTAQGVAPGSIVSIFGTNLAASTAIASAVPLPTALSDVTSVTFNNIPAGLFFVSQNQINAQLPFDVLPPDQGGTVNVVVSRSSGESPPQNVTVTPASPGIFTTTANGLGQAFAYDNSTGALAAPAGAAIGPFATAPLSLTSGHALIIACTGLGAVTPSIDDYVAASDGTFRNTLLQPTVLIGGVPAQLIYSVLSPQFPSEYQIGVTPPANTPTGDAVSLQIQIGGVTTSKQVTIAVAP